MAFGKNAKINAEARAPESPKPAPKERNRTHWLRGVFISLGVAVVKCHLLRLDRRQLAFSEIRSLDQAWASVKSWRRVFVDGWDAYIRRILLLDAPQATAETATNYEAILIK